MKPSTRPGTLFEVTMVTWRYGFMVYDSGVSPWGHAFNSVVYPDGQRLTYSDGWFERYTVAIRVVTFSGVVYQ